MMAVPQSLAEIQAWMLNWIQTSALGVDSSDVDVAEVILPGPRQSSQERLQIYAQAYLARLVECLQEEFSALHNMLGDDAFTALAAAYLEQFPPRSYTLAQLGSRFPEFLAATAPATTEPGDNSASHWSQLLVEVAQLERCYAEVFDGPGIETDQHPVFEPAALQAQSPAELRVTIDPLLRCLNFQFPVHDYVTEVRRDESAPLPAAEPTWLIVFRRNYVVRRLAVSPLEWSIIRNLQTGATLAEALAAACAEATELPPDNEFGAVLRTWFQAWTERGWIRGITPA